MRNLKKLLSLVMALAMVASFMVMGASAAEFTDGKDIENVEAVNTLSDLGIIKGRDTGAFDPEGIVTRAEMAKMICVTMAGGKDPNMTGVGVFSDTKGHWAAGYIDYCVNMGFIAGYPDGTFQPNKTVTGTEAAKMILTIIGYNAETEKFVGDVNWETNINAVASSKGIYDGAAVVPNAGLTRDDAAQMLYNGVQTALVKYELAGIINGNGVSVAVDINPEKTILGTRFDLRTAYVTLEEVSSYDAKKGVYTYEHTDAADNAAGEDFPGTLKSFSDFTRFFGQDVRVLYKDNKDRTVYGVTARNSEVVAEGILGDIDDGKPADTSFDFDGDTYKTDKKLSETPVYYFNEDMVSKYNVDAIDAKDLAYTFKAIDFDGDGKVDHLVVTPFSVAKVTNVSKNSITVSGNNAVTKSYDLEDIDVYDDVAKGDYVMVTKAVNTAKHIATFTEIETVEGKITATNSDEDNFTIGGETYTISKNLQNTGADFGNGNTNSEAGATLTNVVTVNGYAFFAEVGESITSADYALMVAGQSGGTGLNTAAQAQLLFTDGTKKTVDIASIDRNADGDILDANEDLAANFGFTATEIGKLYAYETNSDGEYELTLATAMSADDSGFDYMYKSGANVAYTKSTGESGRIGGRSIAEDAVIFVKNTDGKYSVKTGADFRKTSTSNVTIVTVAYTDKVSSTGMQSVKLAYATADVASSDDMYGYVTAAPKNVTNEDGKIVTRITFWNGTEEQTLLADAKVSVKKHDAIKYTLDGDTMKVGTNNTVKDSKMAIIGVDGDDLLVVRGDIDGDAGEIYTINDDTVVLYVNVEDAEGVIDEDNINLADEKVDPDNQDAEFYFANAYIEATPNGDKYDITLLIIDIANDIADAQ